MHIKVILEAYEEMFIDELTIENFKSFYGRHHFCFKKGINIVQSDSGVGKTNLCKAIEFALFGSIGLPLYESTSLINMRKVEETVDENEWTGCAVNLRIIENNEMYWRNRRFSTYGEHDGTEKLFFSNLAPKMNSLEYNEFVYVVDLAKYGDEGSNESIGKNMLSGLDKIITQNTGRGFGFLFIDDSLDRFSTCNREKAFNMLAESTLDQIIILAGSIQEIPVSIASNIICLGKTIESITFEIHNFPFQSQNLAKDIDLMIYDRYVSEGEIFKREVYGHEYTIEAVKVVPNGGIYRRNISKIII